MISLESVPGMFSWTCDGELGLASFCIQRTIIDIVNLVFVCVFYVTLLISSLRQNQVRGSDRRGWLLTFASICCGLISTAYFIYGLWNLVGKTSESNPSGWLVYILKGLIWMSSTVSVLAQRSKWIKVLNFVWWVLSCLLVSALNIEILIRVHTIQLFELLEWSINFILLFCAIRNLCYLVSQQREDSSLSEPLVAQKDENNERGKCKFTFFNRFTFSWINPLLRLGYSKPLAPEDVPSLESEDEANVAYEKFQQTWSSLLRGKPSNSERNLVLWTLTRVHLNENIYIAICALLRTIAVLVSPLILYAFMNYMNQAQEDPQGGFYILGCLIVCKVVESLCQRQWFFHARRSGMRMRSALMVAVYQKQLKLSSSGRRRHSTGEIVNYIAVDAYRMGEFPWWFHTCWSCVVQLFLGVAVLFKVAGLGALLGLVPLLICGLLNLPYAKMLQRCQMGLMVAQDERLRTTSEILNNMKVIKLQSWEDKFKNLVETFRAREFTWLAEAQFKKAYATIIYWMSPTIVSSVVFLGCALFNISSLNAATIFTVLATLRILSEPVRVIPEGLSVLIQVKVSFNRLNGFFLDDEVKADEIRSLNQNEDSSIIIHEGHFNWDENSATPTLRDLNLKIKWGQKIAVCGPVGAGKSSLLHAILGVIPKLSGTVSVYGSIAYVSQTAWIQSGTVRDNILFGKPMDETRYENAIKACALDKDISSFSHGDLTEIGQRGLNLSGGQKQRLQLARAVYNDADIYLLDDPFSAVDAHTAAILFKDCVMAALENKTVVLVTHQVEFLSDVDEIIVMEDGKIAQSGSFEDLLMVGTPFEQLVNAHKDAMTVLDTNNKGQGEPEKITTPFPEKEGSSLIKQDSEADISSKGPAGGQLTHEEEMEIGYVGWKPFWDYLFLSKGAFLLCVCLLTQIGFVSFQAAATYWLALAIQIPNISNALLIGTYTAFSFLSAVFVFFRSLSVAHLGLKGSKSFFTAFNNAIFKAPMTFFDSTPVGRILTRASSDLGILDYDIPFSIAFAVAPAIEILAIIVIMASVTWQVLIVAIPAMVATKFIQDYYLATARELIRINGTTKAPVMNYASETSLGVVTIRAFNMVDRFFRNYLKLVDTDARLFFYSNGSMEWLILRIEILQNLTLFAAAFFILCLPKGSISPGLAGLSLSYAFTLTITRIFLCRWYCNLSNHIISVERIKQFIHIPSEPPAIVEENRPPSSWPSKGKIELQALKIRYRENAPLVLKGISCTFKEGHRVGVVGRTGSGKTTLISALFRLVEPVSGQILIDGVNICSIGLKDLRMKLSIIPQEPTLFRGSVRTNLDPLGLYSDEEIWKALEKCQLKATISSLPSLLDSSVSDEGENWSAGQRQLFCLGRILLKRNKILVLDEATASIDSTTDAILQRIIRQEFSDCTVITVAHRVPTVLDSDLVMVLSYGNLLEYDQPSKLMETNSLFSKLVAEYWSSCGKN